MTKSFETLLNHLHPDEAPLLKSVHSHTNEDLLRDIASNDPIDFEEHFSELKRVASGDYRNISQFNPHEAMSLFRFSFHETENWKPHHLSEKDSWGILFCISAFMKAESLNPFAFEDYSKATSCIIWVEATLSLKQTILDSSVSFLAQTILTQHQAKKWDCGHNAYLFALLILCFEAGSATNEMVSQIFEFILETEENAMPDFIDYSTGKPYAQWAYYIEKYFLSNPLNHQDLSDLGRELLKK